MQNDRPMKRRVLRPLTELPDAETLAQWESCGEISAAIIHLVDIIAQMAVDGYEMQEGQGCAIDCEQFCAELRGRNATANIARMLGNRMTQVVERDPVENACSYAYWQADFPELN